MRFSIDAACGCSTGKIRKNNEDNFYFDGKCLEKENDGLKYPVTFDSILKNGFCVSVFDGMGGENFGEYASFAAARQMQQTERKLSDFFVPARQYLLNLVNQMNDAVLNAQKEMCTERMGSTLVTLYFIGRYVYSCNLGDSRAYRLRDGEFLQISEDHVEKRSGMDHKKAPLTQYLGINTDDMEIEPYIAKGTLKQNDMYLLCSDGLTDMLTNFEISDIMMKSEDAEDCVQSLIQAALAQGGRDNITAIICIVR